MTEDFYTRQVAYTPEVVGEVSPALSIVVGGMGGSGLPGRVLRTLMPERSISVHQDYGLPTPASAHALYIALSFSGDTEETLSFFDAVQAREYNSVVITSGGLLLERAKEAGVPYVVVPSGMQPRDGLLALIKALLAVIGEEDELAEWSAHPSLEKEVGEAAATLAGEVSNRMPLFYASNRNEPLAYIAKIICNETAKVPAFSNVFSEMNHNELQSFGGPAKGAPLTAVLIRDADDHERITKRMDAFSSLLLEQGVPVYPLTLPKGTRAYQTLWLWLALRSAAHALAAQYGVPADEVPLIQRFKGML